MPIASTATGIAAGLRGISANKWAQRSGQGCEKLKGVQCYVLK
jgi:hypothetical protein